MERPRSFISEVIGQDVTRFAARRYGRGGCDSIEIAREISDLTGIQPTPQTVRNWIKIGGGTLRDPRQRDSASYMWTEEAIKERNRTRRKTWTPERKTLHSEKIKRYWRRRKFGEYKAQFGSPYARITASERA